MRGPPNALLIEACRHTAAGLCVPPLATRTPGVAVSLCHAVGRRMRARINAGAKVLNYASSTCVLKPVLAQLGVELLRTVSRVSLPGTGMQPGRCLYIQAPALAGELCVPPPHTHSALSLSVFGG